jgi:hypothetical protein
LPHNTNGNTNMSIGTSVRRVRDVQRNSLDAGGGNYFHRFNVPALGCWTQVIVNMHPHVATKNKIEKDVGNLPHPTGEKDYNYFDTLTQFYIEARFAPQRYPVDYLFDEMEFYREPYPENDDQVSGLTATHIPSDNRLIVTWNRSGDDDVSAHEVRYAFADIHSSGWEKAQPAPRGTVPPAGKGVGTGMVYDARDLPLAGQKTVYIAVKPRNADTFSQIAVPLTLK